MKEVKKCSISGVAFTMDTDAYQELEVYLESLKKTYRDTPDGAEIVADIDIIDKTKCAGIQNQMRLFGG